MRTITVLLFAALVAVTYAAKMKELTDLLMYALSDSAGTPCTVTTALNLRSSPSTNGGYIRTLSQGSTVNVHSINNGWAQVDGGYCSAQYLNCGSVTRCATTALNLRDSPSTSGRYIRTIPQGGSVKVYSTSNGWSQVDGGFVSAQYLGDCGGSPSGPGYNCGQAYDNGRAIGDKRCVKIDGQAVVTSTADVFNRMKSAAASAGVTLRINSGFRTMSEQEYFWNCYQTKRCNNGNLAARPGYSNHQNGIALDINCPSNVYNWLARHASSYGFVRTVPSETWHWEYRPGTRCNHFVSYSCN